MQYGICLTHQKSKDLFCATGKVKICQDCVNAVDDAVHKDHEVKPLSDILGQAKTKSAELKSEAIKFDKEHQKVFEILENKKTEAFRQKKRKFDAIRSYIDKVENEVWSEIGLLFAQKKTKTEQQFKKDQELRQNIQVRMSALEEAKLDETFFTALSSEKNKEKDTTELEVECLNDLTKKIENELSLTEQNVNKSLDPILQKFYPDIQGIRIQKVETPSKKVDPRGVVLLQISSLLKVRRKGEVLEILYQDKYRSEDEMKNDIAILKDCEGVKSVKLKLGRQRLSEQILFSLCYLWKGLKGITSLTLDLFHKNNTVQDYIDFFERSFWVSEKVESFKLEPIQESTILDTPPYGEALMMAIFKALALMPNIKDLCLFFPKTTMADLTLLHFAYYSLRELRKLEQFELHLVPGLSEERFEEFWSCAREVLFRVKTFCLDLGFIKVTQKFLETLANALYNFDALEKLKLHLGDMSNITEEQNERFWFDLRPYVKNVKSLSISMTSRSISDPFVKTFAEIILPFLPLIENLKMDFSGCDEITDLTLENIIKHAPKFDKLKVFKLLLAGNKITDHVLQVFAKNLIPTKSKLEKLELIFEGGNIGDGGANELWKNLMPLAENLKTFKFCFLEQMTDSSFQFFVDNIVPKLTKVKKLALNLRCCNFNSIERFFLRLKDISSHIEDLELDFEGSKITDEIIEVFVVTVLPLSNNLRKISMNHAGTGASWDSVEKICSGLKTLPDLEYVKFVQALYEVPSDNLEILSAENPKLEISPWMIYYD